MAVRNLWRAAVRAVALGLPLLATLTAPAQAPAPAALANSVSAWCHSLQNFQGDYVISQRIASSGAPEKRVVAHYRFQQADRLLRHTETDDAGAERTQTDVFHGGKWAYRLEQPGKAPLVAMNAGTRWPLPAGTYMLPDELFSPSFGGCALLDRLREGAATASERDGFTVLSVSSRRSSCSGVDIWLTPEMTPLKIEWAVHYGKSPEESASIGNGDPLAARVVQASIEFFNIVDVNGVQFPLQVLERFYANTPKMTELMDAARAGTLPMADYARAVVAEAAGREPDTERRAEFVPESLQVNTVLPEDAFQLSRAPGDQFADFTNGPDVTIVPHWYQHYSLWLLALAILGALLALRQMRHRHHVPGTHGKAASSHG